MEDESEIFFDVVVIGAGPAGVTTAVELARKGISVALIEKQESFSGKHGDTLPLSFFQVLPVWAIEAKEYLSSQRIIPAIRKWEEDNKLRFNASKSLLIDRTLFDQYWFLSVKRENIVVYRPFQVTKTVFQKSVSDWPWQVSLRNSNECKILKAKYIVHATGVMGSERELINIDHDLLSFKSCVSSKKLDFIHSGIEAIRNGWLWYCVKESGIIDVYLFTNSEVKKRYKNKNDLMKESLCQSKIFVDSNMMTSVVSCTCHTYLKKNGITLYELWVGNSLMGLDPISSQGIMNAIQSGLRAAYCIESLLKGIFDPQLIFDFYNRRNLEDYEFHCQKIKLSYESSCIEKTGAFWKTYGDQLNVGDEVDTEEKLNKVFPNSKLRVSDKLEYYEGLVIGDNKLMLDLIYRHPSLARDTAFIQNVRLSNLLTAHLTGTPAEIISSWDKNILFSEKQKILNFLIQKKILICS